MSNPKREPERPEAPNPFDPARYRLDPGEDLIGGVKVITTVPIMRPPRQDYIRVHPGEDYQVDTAILDLEGDGDSFLVDKKLHKHLAHELKAVTLFTTMSRGGLFFLWPVKLPDPSGRRNRWTESATQAANLGKSHWVRVLSNRTAGQYDTQLAAAELPEPEWPNLSFTEILEKAFRSDVIDTLDHPALRRLAGR